jgi:low temperature requirement protein LtrA
MIPFSSIPFIFQFLLIWFPLAFACIWVVNYFGETVFELWDDRDSYDPGPIINFIRITLFLAAFFVGPWLILKPLEDMGVLV